MTAAPPILYLVHREALSSVFSSQVMKPLEEHRRHTRVSVGIHTPIGHLLRPKYRPALQAIHDRCTQSSIDIGWLPSPPSRTPWLWSDAFLLRQWALKKYGQDQPLIVRCRNAAMTCIAINAFRHWDNARIVFDCRGAEVIEQIQQLGLEHRPESAWSPSQKQSIERAQQREVIACTQSAGITCVSQAMVDSLQKRYPQIPSRKFHVVPCCPDVASFQSAQSQREAVRQELGLSDRFVVTYLGSLVWYQQPEASLRVFQNIRKLRDDAHFLAITTEPDKMHQLAQQAGIPDTAMTVVSVAPRDVPRLLVASDIALMLRDQSETNRVASPVKFGEYLAAGIPVLITPGLGDASEIVTQHQLGLVVNLDEDDTRQIDTLQTITSSTSEEQNALRQRCSRYAQHELSWTSIVPRLIHWYEELLNPAEVVHNSAVSSNVGVLR